MRRGGKHRDTVASAKFMGTVQSWVNETLGAAAPSFRLRTREERRRTQGMVLSSG